MDKFRQLLREINTNLDLPQPIKSQIILEIAADLEDTVSGYKNQGLNEEEAYRKAREIFSFDKKTLRELKSMYQSPFRKWFDQLSAQGQTKFERILLLIIVFIVFSTGTYAALNTALFHQSGPFIWGIFFVLLCSTIAFSGKLYQIYLKKDHAINKIRSGVSAILFMACLSIFLCIAGYYWQAYNFGVYGHTFETNLIYLLDTTHDLSPQVYTGLVTWTLQSTLFIMVSILITIIIAFMWFFVMNKISKIEVAHAESLLFE